MPDIVILAGPNGAGKTTAAGLLVPKDLELSEFVNADEIARGLSPFNVDTVAVAAGRIMIARMRDLVRHRRGFAFETTCAGRSHLPLLHQCKAAGWRITLLFLYLPSPEAALARVARRVQHGGHGIPDHVVVRRYWGGLVNLRDEILPLADVAAIYDNSDAQRILIGERTPGSAFIVHDAVRWARIAGAKQFGANPSGSMPWST